MFFPGSWPRCAGLAGIGGEGKAGRPRRIAAELRRHLDRRSGPELVQRANDAAHLAADRRQGHDFENAIAPTPLCCPSRAAFLTGQYGHNNGVLRNRYGDLLNPGNVLPVWLQNAGYTTAHVGKWLNDYEANVDEPGKPAPGWDFWRTAIGDPTY